MTATSAPRSRKPAAMRSRLAALVSPANSSGWTSSRAVDGAGRSAHTASIGFAGNATRLAPLAASAAPVTRTQSRVWSHGSKPMRSPARAFAASQSVVVVAGTAT